MRKQVEESAAAGARRATGAAAERDRKGRFSARRKRATVLRLLRGEDLESVSRALGIAATASQDSCLFHPRNCRAVETGLVRVDDAELRVRRISQRLAEQACGRSGIAPPREHEVDRGAAGIDGSVEVAPTVLDTNVGLIDTPGLIGWLEMMAQPFLQFGTVHRVRRLLPMNVQRSSACSSMTSKSRSSR